MGIFNRLPIGYQEVEYIESSGTQYINTGISSITKEFAIEMDFSITTSQEYQTLWCCRTHNVDVTRTCFTTGLTGFRNDQGTQTPISASLSLNQKYNLKSTKTQFILDDVVLENNISTTNNAINDKVWLLSSYAVGTSNPSNQFKGKLYSCKIWDNDELIRYYIPCYRKSDDEIGLYDIVNNAFYENAGTGVFAKGDNVDSVKSISIGLKEVKQIEDTNGNIWWKKTGGVLPSTYTQVDYIENTGQSYINTNFILNQNSKVELTVYSTNFTQGHLFGSRESATSKNFTISDGHLDFGSYTSNRINFYSHANNLKTKLTMDKNTFTVDNETYNDTYNLATVNDFTCIAPAYIFYVSGNPYGNYRVWGKLYGCKIWDNGTLVRDLIPCYRNSDNEAGLYDLANDVFYTNAGTGEFSYGYDNLFDPDTAVILQSYFQTGQSVITASAANRMSYIQCKPNTTYEISKLLGRVFWVGYTTQYPENGIAVSGITQGTQDTFDGATRTSLDFTTGNNATYLVFRYTQIYMDGSANADTIKNSIVIYEK